MSEDTTTSPTTRSAFELLGGNINLGLTIILGLSAFICFVCDVAEFLERPTQLARRVSRWLPSWLPSRPPRSKLKYLILTPPLVWLVCGALGVAQLFMEPSRPVPVGGYDKCGIEPTVNPDIGGIGVRISLEMTMGSTLVSILLGAFGYCGETGTKELGAASFISK